MRSGSGAGADGAAARQPRVGWVELAVLVMAVVAHLLHQGWFAGWYIEDAAIDFAYAANLVAGEGAVPWPGGERVEAYSNPTWVLLIALFHAVGVEGWVSGKLLAAVFGSGSLVLAWLLAREAIPEEGPPDPAEGGPGFARLAALVAPLALGFNASHAIWSASALENSLFTFLLLAGILRVLREERVPAFPWSAAVFLALAATRPEGILYAAVAGAAHAWFTRAAGRGWRPTFTWLAVFWAPYLAMVAFRIWYFAWPLPITYYAKLGTHDWHVLHQYYQRGWMQIREYCQVTWLGAMLPVYVLGLTTARGRAGRAGGAVIAVLGAMLMVPGPQVLRDRWFWPELPEPYAWLVTRIAALWLVGALLPLAAVGTSGARARILCWYMVLTAVFFSVFSNGDWTVGLRWMSLFAGTSAVIFACGVSELARVAARLAGQPPLGSAAWLVASLLTLSLVPPHVSFSRWYAAYREFNPADVKLRVDYTTALARRVYLDEPVRTLDMDMGAHLWYSDQRVVDMAGLVDVPMALHGYRDRNFVQERVYDEGRPHFAHIHATWAEISGLKTYPGFGEDYVPLQGYAEGSWFHAGMYARRDLVMADSWPGTAGRRVELARGVTLEGFDVPSPEIGQGRSFFLEVGFSSARREPDDPFAVTAFLSSGQGLLASWDLPMGQGMLDVSRWEPDEVFVGRYALEVPRATPPGAYELGFVVTGARGYVLRPVEGGAVPAGAVVGGAAGAVPRMAHGEVRFPGVVLVLPGESASDQQALADRLGALDAAWNGRCEEGERRWWLARMHVPRHLSFHEQFRPEVGVALSRCWVGEAARQPERRVELLERALTWDHRNQDFLHASAAAAAELYAEGQDARRAGDWERAYRAFSDAVGVMPHHAWARRYAEEARDHRLGIYEKQPWGTVFGPW